MFQLVYVPISTVFNLAKYDEKVYELQCIINEQADNLKYFRNKVSEMLHTLQVKFGITEKDLNTESVKFSKSSNNTKKIER